MRSGSFTTAAAYPAVPQITPNPASVRIDLIVDQAVTVEIWRGSHGQAVSVGEFVAQQSVQIAGATGLRVKDAVSGTHANCTWTQWETKDPLPSYIAAGATQTSPVTIGGGLVGITVLSGAGTFTPAATSTAILVELVGGGGGGGGSGAASSAASGGGGGGAGGYCRAYISALAASYAFSMGTQGAQGSIAGGNGGNGGNSTFGALSASGGNGGAGVNAAGTQGAGGTGGAGAGGDLNLTGGSGSAAANSAGGLGGASYYGGGGAPSGGGGIKPSAAPGSGGGGGTGISATGGLGGGGIGYVWEYA